MRLTITSIVLNPYNIVIMSTDSLKVSVNDQYPLIYKTTKSHQAYLLASFSFLIFEGFFLCFYAFDFWFGLNITYLGIPTLLIAIGLAHLFLLTLESKLVCKICQPLFKGKPPVFYQNFAVLDKEKVTCGTKEISCKAISALDLSLFGVLDFKSSLISGNPEKPDKILSLPLGILSQAKQKEFLEHISQSKSKLCSEVIATNKRLDKRKKTPHLKGSDLVQCLGAAILFLTLLDLANSTFIFLEGMKDLYQSEKLALGGNKHDAQSSLEEGLATLKKFPDLSWVSTKLIKHGSIAASLEEQKARSYFALNQIKAAQACAQKALELNAKSYRLNLFNMRLAQAAGNCDQAYLYGLTAVSQRENNLLPRLYLIAFFKENKKDLLAQTYYEMTRADFANSTFEGEPLWPPGSQKMLHEIIYENDLNFIFNNLIRNTKSP